MKAAGIEIWPGNKEHWVLPFHPTIEKAGNARFWLWNSVALGIFSHGLIMQTTIQPYGPLGKDHNLQQTKEVEKECPEKNSHHNSHHTTDDQVTQVAANTTTCWSIWICSKKQMADFISTSIWTVSPQIWARNLSWELWDRRM